VSQIIEPPRVAKTEEPVAIKEERDAEALEAGETAEEVQPADQAVELSGKEDNTLEPPADEGSRETE
jgi:hypothetical protein